MGLSPNGKKSDEYELKELGMDMLSQLRVSLLAKLILVNKELSLRWKNVSSLTSNLPNVESARAVCESSAADLDKFNSILYSEFKRITGNPGSSNSPAT
jgi:hypothetical protein